MSSACFVPGCKTGYLSDKKKRKSEGKKNLSLFMVPREKTQLQKWKMAIRRADREIHRTNKVCELHFLPEEISRYFIHNMPDGKVVYIKRERPSLMANAIPTIFPYLSKSERKKKHVKRMPLSKKSKEDNDNAEPEEIIFVDEIVPRFTFNDLLINLSQVSEPHKLWGVSSHEDFIICVKWKLSFIPEFKCRPERQIIVDSNLCVKIMYNGTEVSITPKTVIESVGSLSQLLREVDQYLVCPGAVKKYNNCPVFIKHEIGSFGRPQKWCKECSRKVSKKQQKQKEIELLL